MAESPSSSGPGNEPQTTRRPACDLTQRLVAWRRPAGSGRAASSRWVVDEDEEPLVYEEQVTVRRAVDADDAIRLAEAEASEYANDLETNYPGLADHARLKASLRPMRGLKPLCSLRTIATSHAFVQNPVRGRRSIRSACRCRSSCPVLGPRAQPRAFAVLPACGYRAPRRTAPARPASRRGWLVHAVSRH